MRAIDSVPKCVNCAHARVPEKFPWYFWLIPPYWLVVRRMWTVRVAVSSKGRRTMRTIAGAIKLTALALLLASQVFFVKYVILPRDRERAEQASVKPGQVWEYKCSLPFHENDAPSLRTVLEVRDGFVKYKSSRGWENDCSVRVFVSDSKLVK